MKEVKKPVQLRELQGTVVSDKMQKTVVVRVDRQKKNPLYHKQFRVSRNYKAHDPRGHFHTGDKVTIYQIRPISRDKRWMVVYPEKASQ